jgi:hypothetical protein
MDLLRKPDHFTEEEFGGVTPHPDLLYLLDKLRDALGICMITSGPRTILDHIKIYRDKYGELWQQKIPWNSRHLPTFKTSYLRAVDLQVIQKKHENGMVDFFHGENIKNEVLKLKGDINVGVGVGLDYIHLDIDRDIPHTVWYYD